MFPTVVTTVPSRGQWLGFEHRLPGFGSCSQRYTQLHSGAGWRGVGGSGLGSSPWITTAALSHSAFPPRSPQGVQQRGPVPRSIPCRRASAGLCPACRESAALSSWVPCCFSSSTFQAQVPSVGLPRCPMLWPWVQPPGLSRSCRHVTRTPVKVYPSSAAPALSPVLLPAEGNVRQGAMGAKG